MNSFRGRLARPPFTLPLSAVVGGKRQALNNCRGKYLGGTEISPLHADVHVYGFLKAHEEMKLLFIQKNKQRRLNH
jgi:hypothetical protein